MLEEISLGGTPQEPMVDMVAPVEENRAADSCYNQAGMKLRMPERVIVPVTSLWRPLIYGRGDER